MKYKNINELTARYYPSDWKLEKQALRELVSSVSGCESSNCTAITNTLFRANICSIRDLHNASVDELKRLRTIGPKRLTVILEVKKFIDFNIEEGS